MPVIYQSRRPSAVPMLTGCRALRAYWEVRAHPARRDSAPQRQPHCIRGPGGRPRLAFALLARRCTRSEVAGRAFLSGPRGRKPLTAWGIEVWADLLRGSACHGIPRPRRPSRLAFDLSCGGPPSVRLPRRFRHLVKLAPQPRSAFQQRGRGGTDNGARHLLKELGKTH